MSALQGGFREHVTAFQKLGVQVIEVKKPEHLAQLQGLVIPGGESTTMAILAEKSGLLEPLKEWIKSKKPTWGTCAGIIFLSNSILGAKQGGQLNVGGLDIEIQRNSFGSQIDSFQVPLIISELGIEPFPAIFIRAPIVKRVNNEKVQILAKHNNDIVAVRQGHLMGTCFHPELSSDTRFHDYFLKMINN